MSLSDYIPEIFGSAPTGYQGLLGEEQTKALQKQANLQGLLGVASGLAQGMSSQGPRRSALQNILGSLAGGYGATQQAYQQGLQSFGQQQQIAQNLVANQQAAATRASIEQLLRNPEIANNPALVASLRADPINTLKWINENMPVAKAYATETKPVTQPIVQPAQVTQEVAAPITQTNEYGVVTQSVQPPSVGIGAQVDAEKSMPPVSVTSTISPLQAQKDRLLTANTRLTGLPGKTAQEAIKSNLDQIAALDKQLMLESAANFDFNTIKNNVHPNLVNQVVSLERLAQTGQITPQDLQKGLQDIQKTDFDYKTKQQDYTNEAIRVAGGMFPNKPINTLSPQELTKLQAKLDQLDIAKRKAGATNINVGEKSFGQEFGKGVAASVENTFNAAQGAQSTLSTIQNIRPVIKAGVYAGPLSTVPRVVNQLAVSLGVTGKNDNEKLQNTAIAMQGLASLELSAAQAMKGQGAITENERNLIKRASAGDLQTFTQTEVLSLLNALEKTSKFKIKAHEKNLDRLRSNPDTVNLVDFYSLDQQGSPVEAPSNVRRFNPETGRIE